MLESMTKDVQVGLPNGTWVPARPYNSLGIRLMKRIRCAWLVFSGQADVLVWDQDLIRDKTKRPKKVNT